MSQSDSQLCGIGGCTNSCEWELAKDQELDGLTDDQLIYLDKAIATTLGDRGWIWNWNDGLWMRDR